MPLKVCGDQGTTERVAATGRPEGPFGGFGHAADPDGRVQELLDARRRAAGISGSPGLVFFWRPDLASPVVAARLRLPGSVRVGDLAPHSLHP